MRYICRNGPRPAFTCNAVCVLVAFAGKALNFLRRWLEAHPTYKEAAAAAGPPPDSSQALSHTSR